MNDDLPYNNLTNMYPRNSFSNSDMDVEPNNNNRSNNNNENSFNSIKVGLIPNNSINSIGSIPNKSINSIGLIQKKIKTVKKKIKNNRSGKLTIPSKRIIIKQRISPFIRKNINIENFINDFKNATVIGKGSYGEVRVVNIGNSFYAVKKITFSKEHNQLQNNDKILKSYNLKSPYLLKTFGHIEITGVESYSIMEYLDGQSWMNLEDYMNQNMNTSHICSKLKDGLTKIHELNFFHQDIKPANIMINRNTTPLQIKFIDYGLSIINPSTSLSSGIGHSTLYGCPVPIGNTYLDQIQNVDIFAVKIICILLKKKLYKNLFKQMHKLIEEFWKQNFNPTVKVPFFPLYNILYLILLEISCDKKFRSTESFYNLYFMFVGNKTPKKGKWNNLEVPNPSSFLKFKYIDRFLINSEICKIIINFLCSLLHREFIIDFATEFENSNILMSFYNQYLNIS